MSWCGGGEISPTPGVEWRTLAMICSTLCPGSWPPSPGLAPCAILICIMPELARYSAVTPKRPEATCLMAERIESPFGSGLKRSTSSPPSPVLDLPPMRFMATASVVCASRLMEPKLMAPVEKRFTMLAAGSTSSSGTGFPPHLLRALDPEEAAQRHQLLGLVVDLPREGAVLLRQIAAHGVLQVGDHGRTPHVRFAAHVVGVLAADIERVLQDRHVAEGQAVALGGLARDLAQPDAFDLGVSPREILLDEARLEPDRVEDSGRRNRTGRWRCPSWTSPSRAPCRWP